jgi:CubicO group peptidase (beta-lactamase class C family)
MVLTLIMLLTKIVEVVSHQSFAAFMQDRVFGPLGMSHSEINEDSTEVIPHPATGYALRSDPSVLKELTNVGASIKPGDGWAQDWSLLVRRHSQMFVMIDYGCHYARQRR